MKMEKRMKRFAFKLGDVKDFKAIKKNISKKNKSKKNKDEKKNGMRSK